MTPRALTLVLLALAAVARADDHSRHNLNGPTEQVSTVGDAQFDGGAPGGGAKAAVPVQAAGALGQAEGLGQEGADVTNAQPCSGGACVSGRTDAVPPANQQGAPVQAQSRGGSLLRNPALLVGGGVAAGAIAGALLLAPPWGVAIGVVAGLIVGGLGALLFGRG